jgi:hypothetical protein
MFMLLGYTAGAERPQLLRPVQPGQTREDASAQPVQPIFQHQSRLAPQGGTEFFPIRPDRPRIKSGRAQLAGVADKPAFQRGGIRFRVELESKDMFSQTEGLVLCKRR